MNADFGEKVVVHTAALDWQASPSPSVWRKRLELSGPKEAGRVTAIVRYDPDSSFSSHAHPDGEEILVLEGVFSDEHGDYPAGTFLLNPEGFSHAPFSSAGCRLFVKLRQYPGIGRTKVIMSETDLQWRAVGETGLAEATLYEEPAYPEVMRLLRIQAGAAVSFGERGGLEILVLEGDLADGSISLSEGSWSRCPPETAVRLRSEQGARCYVKSGHLDGH